MPFRPSVLCPLRLGRALRGTRARALCAAATAGVMAGLTGVALADSVALAPERDNTLYSESGDLSNGQGAGLFVGLTGQFNPGQVRRALLRFDLAGAIPPGSVIESVTLRLTLSQAPNPQTQVVALHEALASWGEGGSDAGSPGGAGAPAEAGDATWSSRFYGTPSVWANPGGDFAPAASASAVIGSAAGTSYTWGSTTAMVADVQGWVDAPATNHGWFLIGNEENSRSTRRFTSRNDPNASARPLLSITFTPPPSRGPGAVPDGATRPGPLLLVDNDAAGLIRLSWGASCRPVAADYAVFVGPLPALATGVYQHEPETCTTGSALVHTLSPTPAGSVYFLVAPIDALSTGSYGLDGTGAERPPGLSSCSPQRAAPFCP